MVLEGEKKGRGGGVMTLPSAFTSMHKYKTTGGETEGQNKGKGEREEWGLRVLRL